VNAAREKLIEQLRTWLAHSRQHKNEHVCIPCATMDLVIAELEAKNAND